MMTIRLGFHGDLEDLRPERERGHDIAASVDGHASLKDLIESFGVPHTEVGRVTVEGHPVDLASSTAMAAGGADRAGVVGRPVDLASQCVVAAGNDRAGSDTDRAGVEIRIDVEPVEFRLDPLDPDPRFVLDVHLGRLARHLRLLGLDALYSNRWEDVELGRVAAVEARWLLTRDRKLLMRRAVTRGRCLRSQDPILQAREIVGHFDLTARLRPWIRCLACGALVEPVDKQAILPRLLPKTRLYYERFRRCAGCGGVYWEGSHHATLQRVIAMIVQEDTGPESNAGSTAADGADPSDSADPFRRQAEQD